VASLETRPSKSEPTIVSHRIKWRQDGNPQGETFGPGHRNQAKRFQLDVEAAGNRWPEDWIKGVGYRKDLLAEPLAADVAFLDFAMQCVRDKTGIQPDTRQRYANHAKVLAYELSVQVAADPEADSSMVTIQNLTDRHVARWINAHQPSSNTNRSSEGRISGVVGCLAPPWRRGSALHPALDRLQQALVEFLVRRMDSP
jgi:hypothetical protein